MYNPKNKKLKNICKVSRQKEEEDVLGTILHNIDEYSTTVIFYLIVATVSTIFAFLSNGKIQSNKTQLGNTRYSRRKIYTIMSFSCLWFVLAFSTCGADYTSYEQIFLNSNSIEYLKTTRIEIGYLLFNGVIRLFTDNFLVFKIAWSFTFLILFYTTVVRYKEYINPGMAVLSLTSMFFYQSMNLMRLYLASMVLFWGYRYIEKNKYIRYGVVVLVAFSIHKSAILMLAPLMFIAFTRKKGHFIIKTLAVLAFVVFVYFEREFLFNTLIRYEHYTAKSTVSFGWAIVVYHVPLLFLFNFIQKKKLATNVYDRITLNTLFVFTISSFAIGVFAYFVEMLGRAFCYFTYPFIILPAFTVYLIRKSNLSSKNKKTYQRILSTAVLFYYIFRAFMMLEYLETDAIAPYTNVFGWII